MENLINKENLDKIAQSLNSRLTPPNQHDIDRVVDKLEKMLQNKKLNRYCNASIKEGYIKALEILKIRQTDFTGLEKIESIQGRSIASLAVDWQNGLCDESVFMGVIKCALKKRW